MSRANDEYSTQYAGHTTALRTKISGFETNIFNLKMTDPQNDDEKLRSCSRIVFNTPLRHVIVVIFSGN